MSIEHPRRHRTKGGGIEDANTCTQSQTINNLETFQILKCAPDRLNYLLETHMMWDEMQNACGQLRLLTHPPHPLLHTEAWSYITQNQTCENMVHCSHRCSDWLFMANYAEAVTHITHVKRLIFQQRPYINTITTNLDLQLSWGDKSSAKKRPTGMVTKKKTKRPGRPSIRQSKLWCTYTGTIGIFTHQF